MEYPSQPNEIARETIRRLSQRKLPPTPEHYRRVYAEVAGAEAQAPEWPEAIRALLAQWDARQTGLNQTKKREMLERVLINFGSQPSELHAKLTALMRSWAESGGSRPVLEGEEEESGQAEAQAGAAETQAPAAALSGAGTAEAVGEALVSTLGDFGRSCEPLWPDLAARAGGLGREIGAAAFRADAGHIQALGRLWREFAVRAEDNHELLEGLKRILGLLFENVGDMLSDDPWLRNRIASVHHMVSQGLSPHGLYNAESSLQEVVTRQKAIRQDMQEAKTRLKGLISTFIDRVGEMTDATGEHHDRIQVYAERIAAADDLAQLNEVMEGLTSEVTRMRDHMRETHTELVEARLHVDEGEQRIQHLQAELERTASLMREDQLTGALNRRGIEEAMERELSRADRMALPLSVAVLDIDHFKRINDTYGHQAGDEALAHLAQVIKQLLRPTDVLGRYGGEEFVILLPNTGLAEAQKTLQRVQRELTRRYFLHDNQRILITFSAGVAERQPQEAQDGVLQRADASMYRAKALGRNRVEMG